VAGLRADYNNKFGFFATPRLNAKYNFTDNLILRIAAGNSFRTANIITDNIGFIVSSKVLVVKEDLQPERGWNEGINLTWKTKIFNRNASVATDFYRTDFTNQIIVDPYSDPNYLQFYNLDGKSYAQSFQATFNYELLQQLSIRFAYKMDNVKTTYYREGLIQKPLVSRNKGLINLSYETLNKIWRANVTMQFDGKKEIVAAHNHDIETLDAKNYSPNYVQLFAQVTKVFRKFEVYLGGENLTNFTQHAPIISAQNPFSKAFDATDVWGPVMGIRVYAGFRMDIN
jgi:outer membrane receptor for ferrienterochelin and colicin